MLQLENVLVSLPNGIYRRTERTLSKKDPTLGVHVAACGCGSGLFLPVRSGGGAPLRPDHHLALSINSGDQLQACSSAH